MKNRIVFITGAANGIGLELSKAIAKKGYSVFLADIDKEKIVFEAKELQKSGFCAEAIYCDASDEKQVSSSIQYILQAKGQLDILINNAGFQYIAPIEDFPIEIFDSMIKLMLNGAFYTTKYVFPIMKEQRFGRIINMASINGLVGFVGKAAYNSAKHGLIGLTKVAALEGAKYGITVNAVCPGYVNSQLVKNQLQKLAQLNNLSEEDVLNQVIYPLVPQQRLLEIEEIVDYVIFLIGENAKGITGTSALIDGGYLAQ